MAFQPTNQPFHSIYMYVCLSICNVKTNIYPDYMLNCGLVYDVVCRLNEHPIHCNAVVVAVAVVVIVYIGRLTIINEHPFMCIQTGGKKINNHRVKYKSFSFANVFYQKKWRVYNFFFILLVSTLVSFFFLIYLIDQWTNFQWKIQWIKLWKKYE